MPRTSRAGRAHPTILALWLRLETGRSEAVLSADRDQIRIEIEIALVGLVVVVVETNAEVVAEVVAETSAGVPLVGGVIDLDNYVVRIDLAALNLT